MSKIIGSIVNAVWGFIVSAYFIIEVARIMVPSFKLADPQTDIELTKECYMRCVMTKDIDRLDKLYASRGVKPGKWTYKLINKVVEDA